MPNRISATVKWFDSNKGFGFLTPENGGKDDFVHISAVQKSGLDTLREGQRVEYDRVAGRKGPQAENIRLISA